MIYEEQKRRLTVGTGGYHIAHAITADCSLTTGVSDEVFKKFHLTQFMKDIRGSGITSPDSILVGRVFNLVTSNPPEPPTYDLVRECLRYMKEQCISEGIHKIAMPKIHEGILSWKKIREDILNIFEDTTVEILVCTN